MNLKMEFSYYNLMLLGIVLSFLVKILVVIVFGFGFFSLFDFLVIMGVYYHFTTNYVPRSHYLKVVSFNNAHGNKSPLKIMR